MGTFEVRLTTPVGEQGVAKVEKFSVSEEASQMYSLRSFIKAGEYTRLYVGKTLMMSDTHMERETNAKFAHKAHGHVLVAGLGLGLILEAVMDSPNIESITVIEKYQDVIDLVAPNLLSKCSKIKVITADIFKWRPPKGTLYNVIYFDIWPDICVDNLVEMTRLHRSFARALDRSDPNAWMDSWSRSYLRSIRRSRW